MRTFHFERDYWSLVRRLSDNAQRVDLAEAFVRVFEQSPLMAADACLADGVDILDCRSEPDGLHNCRRAGFELVGRLPVGNAVFEHLMDHFAATIERWHRF